ncbi:MAG TPA: di-trans,poly-cis-decaprenylcistransferase [Archaeoglobaceae archaeon]|nr:di-trans,poly-cis-decaprenylcistransferase [Archaeoglobaceae archaeon]
MLIHKIYERRLTKQVKKREIPRHVAIIMDGNRRFARRRGLPPKLGHIFGSRKAEEVLEWCWELGIRNVTIYAFSTENFKRSEEEKQNIFNVVEKELRRLSTDSRTHKKGVRVKVVGRIDLLPENVTDAIENVERVTEKYSNFNLNIALAYGGRQELIDAVREIVSKVKRGEIKSDEIDSSLIEKHLYGEGDYSEVDLVIRTGGELRLSNFLTWQTASSVAYFCDIFWPQFRKIDLLRAIRTWQNMLKLREKKRGILNKRTKIDLSALKRDYKPA